MKKDIHPQHRAVVFWDLSSDVKFLAHSTVNTSDTTKWEDGQEYPLVKVEVSSASHPFYTGKSNVQIRAGRVERFHKKYNRK